MRRRRPALLERRQIAVLEIQRPEFADREPLPRPELFGLPVQNLPDGDTFGKWHLGDTTPLRPEDRGFQESLYFGGWSIETTAAEWNSDCFDDTYVRNGEPEDVEGYCTDVWFDEAMEWMHERQADDEPFFCYLPTNAPHGPHYVPQEHREPYEDHPLVVEADRDTNQVAGFYGMIDNLDWNMGRLESMLAETGLRENTILLYITDNGSSRGTGIHNAGMRGKKGDYYEGGHRVPCFVRWPAAGWQGGRPLDDLTAHIDVLPTLIDACALETPRDSALDGVNLAPRIRGDVDNLPDRTIPVFHRFRWREEKWTGAMMAGSWRLVNGDELYDIDADPGQEENVAEDHPEVVDRLRDAYEAYWESVEPTFDDRTRIAIGDTRNDATSLSAFHWDEPGHQHLVWRQHGVRRGEEKISSWLVAVERSGRYEIALYRWPPETDTDLRDAVGAHELTDVKAGELPAGNALPIHEARIRIGDHDRRVQVDETDRAATFHLPLAQGPARLETWFYDASGEPLCSAYYATVRYLSEDTEE